MFSRYFHGFQSLPSIKFTSFLTLREVPLSSSLGFVVAVYSPNSVQVHLLGYTFAKEAVWFKSIFPISVHFISILKKIQTIEVFEKCRLRFT